MRTLKLLLKRMRAEKSYLIAITILSIFIVVGYFSYAMFTVNKEQKEAIRIITGTLTGELKVDNIETNKLVVNQGETKEFTVTLRNNNDRTARYLLYYIGDLSNGLEAEYVVEEGIQIPPEEKGRNITVGTTETYKIKVKNSTTSSQTIQLKLDAGLEKFDLTIPNNGHLFKKMKFTIPEDTPMREYINDENTEYGNDTKNKMFVFHHEETEQQRGWSEVELTDYRYIGADPNNYVTFNGEEAGWRIIGVFTVDDGTGKKETRIKLIRNETLEADEYTRLPWDTKLTGIGSSESDDGSNDWTDANLMMLLNPGYENNPYTSGGSLYWNRQAGSCTFNSYFMDERVNYQADCDFRKTGLTEEARNMIGNTKWYLGAVSDTLNENNMLTDLGLASDVYRKERGSRICYTEHNCSKERSINFVGKVGLLYLSDYGYASTGMTSDYENYCAETDMSFWFSGIPSGFSLEPEINNMSVKLMKYDEDKECYEADWLSNRYDETEYFLTPTISSNSSVSTLFVVFTSSLVDYDQIVRPVVYLSSDVRLENGSGTIEDPFVFAK